MATTIQKAVKKKTNRKKTTRKKAASKKTSTTTSRASRAKKRAKPLVRAEINLKSASAELEKATAEERIAWTLKHFPRHTVLSSSFGAQAAVSLHLATKLRPKMPVILVDTGYLFPETYKFIDELKERLNLNLKIYRGDLSPAWQEARFGKMWETKDLKAIEQYNLLNKVEPMNRALKDLKAKAWISGVRRQQSSTREKMDVLAVKNGVLRVHPIIDWTDKDIFDYLKANDLPYHPLWEEGYVSIGDWHTSHKLTDVQSEQDSRFFGLKRECGLHEETQSADEAGDFMI